MKSLRNYASYRAHEQPQDPTPNKTAESASMDTVQSYLQMSQEERWKLLLQKVASSRASGTMTDGDLDRMAQSAQAMLSPEQYAEMLRMIDLLKRPSSDG